MYDENTESTSSTTYASADTSEATETTQEELLSLVEKLNHDPDIHGILVQLPLPDHINETIVLRAVSPDKDVDGFHPYNVGLLVEGNPRFISCTPHGIIKMLEYYDIDIKGKEC